MYLLKQYFHVNNNLDMHAKEVLSGTSINHTHTRKEPRFLCSPTSSGCAGSQMILIALLILSIWLLLNI